MLAHRGFNCFLIDVHYFIADRLATSHAVLPCLNRKRDAFLDRLCKHHGLPVGVARHGTNLLVVRVIGTHRIAVAQEYIPAIEIDDLRVAKQRYSGFGGEFLADHEVAVTMHKVHRNIGVDQIPQCTLHIGVVGVWVVITEPHIEQVAQNIERLRFERFVAEEVEKLLADLRLSKLEMQV